MELWRKIQRVPRGLLETLDLAGGIAPLTLASEVRPVLDTLQMYGLGAIDVRSAADAALAEGATMTIQIDTWFVLYGAQLSGIKTATMTALRGNIILFRSGPPLPMVVASEELGPFGATETGSVSVCWRCPYPLLCAPGTQIQGQFPIIGTDATVNASIRCEVGVLG